VLRPASASDCRFACERRACSSHRIVFEDVGSKITSCVSMVKSDMALPWLLIHRTIWVGRALSKGDLQRF
jgi:hypothetical protein